MVNVATLIVGFLCLVGCWAALGPKAPPTDDVALHVVLNMYSGKPDPCWSWKMPKGEYELLGFEGHLPHKMQLGDKMGYRGFTVYKFSADRSAVDYKLELPECMSRQLEEALLNSAPPCLALDTNKCRLKPSSKQYVFSQIHKPCN